jgi:hypothetical protein
MYSPLGSSLLKLNLPETVALPKSETTRSTFLYRSLLRTYRQLTTGNIVKLVHPPLFSAGFYHLISHVTSLIQPII